MSESETFLPLAASASMFFIRRTDQRLELALLGHRGQRCCRGAQDLLERLHRRGVEGRIGVGVRDGRHRAVGLVQHLLLRRARHELHELQRGVLVLGVLEDRQVDAGDHAGDLLAASRHRVGQRHRGHPDVSGVHAELLERAGRRLPEHHRRLALREVGQRLGAVGVFRVARVDDLVALHEVEVLLDRGDVLRRVERRLAPASKKAPPCCWLSVNALWTFSLTLPPSMDRPQCWAVVSFFASVSNCAHVVGGWVIPASAKYFLL